VYILGQSRLFCGDVKMREILIIQSTYTIILPQTMLLKFNKHTKTSFQSF